MTDFHRSPEWFALVRREKPRLQAAIDAGHATCIDCGRPVLPGQRWQVGHRLARSTHPHLALEAWNVGPSHSGKGNACNQREGARLGNKLRAQRKERSSSFIDWRRSR